MRGQKLAALVFIGIFVLFFILIERSESLSIYSSKKQASWFSQKGNPTDQRGKMQRTFPLAAHRNTDINPTSPGEKDYWAAVIGGDDYDSSENICATRDNGYAITGFSWSHSLANHWNFWVIKLNRFGQVEWQRSYGNEVSESGEKQKMRTSQYGYTVRWGGKAIVSTDDGGYLLGGPLYFGPDDAELWLVKLDSKGKIKWQYTLGGHDYEWFHWMEQTSDGGFIVAGLTQSFGEGGTDLWLIKLKALGEVEWQKAYQTSGNLSLVEVHQTEDGGFIGVGNIYSPEYEFKSDFLVMKFSASGEVQWAWRYGGDLEERARSIIQTSDGGYLVAGSSRSFGAGSQDIWLLKLNAQGQVEWQRCYGGEKDDSASVVRAGISGGYVVVGETYSFGSGGQDIITFKLNKNGLIEWQKAYGGNEDEAVYSLVVSENDGYVLSGETYSYGRGKNDAFVLKMSPTGEIPYLPELIISTDLKLTPTNISPGKLNVDSWSTNAAPLPSPGVANDVQVDSYLLFNAPRNFQGQRVLNRSLSQKEYIDVLRWAPHPSNLNLPVTKYKVYRIETDPLRFKENVFYTIRKNLVAEVESNILEAWVRNVDPEEEVRYAVVAVNEAGQEGVQAFTTVK